MTSNRGANTNDLDAVRRLAHQDVQLFKARVLLSKKTRWNKVKEGPSAKGFHNF